MILRAVAVWFLILITVVLTGALRQALLEPRLGELRAHQIGTLLACAAVFLVIFLTLPWLRPTSLQALGIGALWLGMALAFEFGFFHFVAGRPWSELLADYDLGAGRLLILLWLTTLFGPVVALLLKRELP